MVVFHNDYGNLKSEILHLRIQGGIPDWGKQRKNNAKPNIMRIGHYNKTIF